MKTLLYLLRHGATAANLSRPARLQGRRLDPPLAVLGVRQAEATRDFLAVRPIDFCYSSPLRRAMETAVIVSQPHALTPQPLAALIECDVGRWEGLDWESIRSSERAAYDRFMANPSEFGYPGGESFAQVHDRAAAALDVLLQRHEGRSILVVSHHIINRTYLARLLGLPPQHTRRVVLDNCGISVVVQEGEHTHVQTLNATFHLEGSGGVTGVQSRTHRDPPPSLNAIPI